MPKGYKRPNGPTLIRLTAKQITELTYCLHELQIRLTAESNRTKGHEPSRKYRVHVLLNLRRTRHCMEYLNPTRRQCSECGLVKRVGAFYHRMEKKYGARPSTRCKRCHLDRDAWKRSDRKRRLKLSREKTNAPKS